MAVLIETETELVTDPAFSGLAQTVVDAALEDAGCPWEAQVNILVTDDDSMRIMNRENRGIDSTTDVLSFPMLEFTEPGDFSFVTEEDWDLFDPETGELLLGDIVLSADRIRAQAEEYGHSVEREAAFLVAHSMYHLFGYDHETDGDCAVMERKQRDLLDRLGITR